MDWPNSAAHAQPFSDTNPLSDALSDANTNSLSNSDADPFSNSDANANSFPDTDSLSHTDPFSDALSDANANMTHIVMLPERLQLGDVLSLRVRKVASIKADRLTVCCPKNQRFLYPTASDFEDVGNYVYGEELERISAAIKAKYPEAEQIRSSWPLPEKELTVNPVDEGALNSDIVICPRFKNKLSTHRNWGGWHLMKDDLCRKNLKVVVVGNETDQSVWEGAHKVSDVESIAAHMLKTKLVVATDSGLAHLAILLRVPLALIWGTPVGVIPGQTYEKSYHKRMEAQKRGVIHHIEGAWQDPAYAVREVLKLVA